eukprot:3981257-Prymnesium_polylepis.2
MSRPLSRERAAAAVHERARAMCADGALAVLGGVYTCESGGSPGRWWNGTMNSCASAMSLGRAAGRYRARASREGNSTSNHRHQCVKRADPPDATHAARTRRAASICFCPGFGTCPPASHSLLDGVRLSRGPTLEARGRSSTNLNALLSRRRTRATGSGWRDNLDGIDIAACDCTGVACSGNGFES